MPIIMTLYLVRGKEKIERLRWIEFRPNAVFEQGVVTWPGDLTVQKGSLSYERGKQLDGPIFKDHLVSIINELGLVPLGLRRESTRRSFWAAVGANATSLAQTIMASLRCKYLVLEPGTVLPDLEVDSLFVVSGVDAGLPMCLRDDHCQEKPVLTPRDARSSAVMASLPCPGYWPVVRVFVPNALQNLAKTVQSALGASQLKGFSTRSADMVRVPSSTQDSTFLRDYWINIFHGSMVVKDTESRSTTKNNGGGFADNSSVINRVLTTDLGGAGQSGFGFGGNFLTCQVDEKIYLFHGCCNHQVGKYSDDHFMVDRIQDYCRETVNLVAIDTGWLKVGHVDEILSFPRPKVALLASPEAYQTLCQSHALQHGDLNRYIEAKLCVIAGALETIGITCIPIPVWFAPVDTDPMHIRSVRGNAVNCIYIGNFAIHSQSGPEDFENRENGASSVIDAEVARIMQKLGYTSLFVDMQEANDEGGAGGNVHCATYTIHFPG